MRFLSSRPGQHLQPPAGVSSAAASASTRRPLMACCAARATGRSFTQLCCVQFAVRPPDRPVHVPAPSPSPPAAFAEFRCAVTCAPINPFDRDCMAIRFVRKELKFISRNSVNKTVNNSPYGVLGRDKHNRIFFVSFSVF